MSVELLLKDGDYVPDGKGGFRTVSGAEEVLQRALFLLTARRGSFPFLPELGSRLYLLPREKPGARAALAQRYAAEALAGEQGVEVTGVECAETGPGALHIRVRMTWRGAELEAEMEV